MLPALYDNDALQHSCRMHVNPVQHEIPEPLMVVMQITHRILPEHVDRYVKATLANAHATRQEPGNVRFDLLRDAADPCTFLLYEVYVDRQAQQAHLAACDPHHPGGKVLQIIQLLSGFELQGFELSVQLLLQLSRQLLQRSPTAESLL